MRLTKEIRYVWPATNHFSGTNKPNSASNAQPLLYSTPKSQNVSVHLTVRMSITEGALNVKSQTFGTPKPNNANGAPKVSSTKKQVAAVYVQRADHTYQTEYALTASHRNTGTIKINRA